MNLKLKMILLIINLSFIGVVSSQNSSNTVQDNLTTIKERGFLIIGADINFPPFEDISDVTSLPEGFDVDLALIIAESMNINVTFRNTAWDPIIPNLQAGHFDIILSAITITEEREVEVDFSRWYFDNSQAWLVKTGNPKNILTEADLNSLGLKIGYKLGTPSHFYSDENLTNVLSQDKHGYDTIINAIYALKQGSVDVVLGNWNILADVPQNDNSLEIGGKFLSEYFGIAVRTGDTALLTEINTVLDSLLGSDPSNPNPTDLYNTIHYKWFDTNAPNYSGSVTDASFGSGVLLSYEQSYSTKTTTPTSTPSSESNSIANPSTKNTITTSGIRFEFLTLSSLIILFSTRKLKK